MENPRNRMANWLQLATHIRDLITRLDEEEREKFREAAEEEGLNFC